MSNRSRGWRWRSGHTPFAPSMNLKRAGPQGGRGGALAIGWWARLVQSLDAMDVLQRDRALGRLGERRAIGQCGGKAERHREAAAPTHRQLHGSHGWIGPQALSFVIREASLANS